MSIQQIIERLDICRPTGKDSYQARCPSHDDRTPSLSIKECPDGRILLKCHAGCGAIDILASIGLEPDAMFPPDENHYRSFYHKKPKGITVDEMVLEIARADRNAGRKQSAQDKKREREAFMRVKRG